MTKCTLAITALYGNVVDLQRFEIDGNLANLNEEQKGAAIAAMLERFELLQTNALAASRIGSES